MKSSCDPSDLELTLPHVQDIHRTEIVFCSNPRSKVLRYKKNKTLEVKYKVKDKVWKK